MDSVERSVTHNAVFLYCVPLMNELPLYLILLVSFYNQIFHKVLSSKRSIQI